MISVLLNLLGFFYDPCIRCILVYIPKAFEKIVYSVVIVRSIL